VLFIGRPGIQDTEVMLILVEIQAVSQSVSVNLLSAA